MSQNSYNLGKINETELSKQVKISVPGIYSNLKLSKCLMTDKHIDFTFTNSAVNEYMDMRIFLNTENDWTGKPNDAEKIAKAETAIIAKLLEVAKAVGDMKDLQSAEGNFSTLLVKLFQYIERKASSASVNLKVVMQSEGSPYTKIAQFGFIEKHETGKEPTLYFSAKEIEGGLTVRSVTAAPTKKTALDDAMFTFSHGASDMLEAPSAAFSVIDEKDMPF